MFTLVLSPAREGAARAWSLAPPETKASEDTERRESTAARKADFMIEFRVRTDRDNGVDGSQEGRVMVVFSAVVEVRRRATHCFGESLSLGQSALPV